VILDPADLLAYIRTRLPDRQPGAPIVAFWYCVDGPRGEYAAAVAAAAAGVIPCVVRRGFQVANQLSTDLTDLIVDHRASLEPLPPPTAADPVVLLLLSRGEFFLPQTASAARLPEWFPGAGGREVTVWVEDLTRTAAVAWDHPAVQNAGLYEAVYRLDRALADRLREVVGLDQPRTDGWFRLISGLAKPRPANLVSHLDLGLALLAGVTSAAKYRITLDQSTAPLTPLATGVVLVGQTSPADLVGLGSSLTEALGMAADPPDVLLPLTALLEESTSPKHKKNKAGRFGQAIIQAGYTAHRLYSVMAHAADYPMYPLALVRGVTDDVVRAVGAAAGAIEARLRTGV